MNQLQKNLILVVTPHIKGGPWRWGADLALKLNETEILKAKHVFSIKDKILIPFNFDKIIHTTNPLVFSFWPKPMILTIHGKIHGIFWKLFYWLAIHRASAVTVPSKFLKNALNLDKALVIPNSINIKEFPEVNLINRNFFNILTVTKFWFPGKAKGIFELAQIVFNLSKDFNKRINWRIVGSGPLLDGIKKSIAMLEKPENLIIQWFGVGMPQKYFSDSDIFAYFSYEDNMPIAIMEAMASGLPVITNEVGAVGELINNGQNGFIAENHNSYQNALLKLIDNFDLRKKIGQMARQNIKDKFSWETILPNWINLYNKFL